MIQSKAKIDKMEKRLIKVPKSKLMPDKKNLDLFFIDQENKPSRNRKFKHIRTQVTQELKSDNID